MLQIGSVQLSTSLLLAPIAGYCDLAFRLTVRRLQGAYGGVGLACTDLLCPQAILRQTDKTLWLSATCSEDRPLCMQLYGRHPEVLAEAALWAQDHGADIIDVNMGCPVDKVTKKNGGSKLLCEPTLAIEIIRKLVRTVHVPITAKIRLGWDDHSWITRTLPQALADEGLAAITVHGRTTEQKFRGVVNRQGIAQVVQTLARSHPHVPVIGNGDVTCPQDVKQMFDETGCQGVMIGRGALSQPWIFQEAAHFLATGECPAPLPRRQRAGVVLDHFENLLRFRGPRVALNMIRQRIAKYSPYLQPWPGLRRDVRQIQSVDAFRQYMLKGMERMSDIGETSDTSEVSGDSQGTGTRADWVAAGT